MSLQARLKSRLEKSRGFLEKVLADFKTPEEWTHQVHPKANHALWVAGHLATVDNFFLSVVAPEKMKDLPGYQEKFGMGSQPTGNPADYPPPEEVLGNFRELRASLLAVLDQMDDEALQQANPPGTPAMIADKAALFEMAAWHEGMHAGQATVARRAFGHENIITRLPR